MFKWLKRRTASAASNGRVTAFFDEATFTASYVIRDPNSDRCALLDTVMDYDPKSGRTSTNSADRIVDYVKSENLTVDWILETHAHADHLSAAPYLKERLGGMIGIGEHIREVQAIFKDVFHLDDTFPADGSQFDHLFKDGETLSIGTLKGRAIHTPGHTPACLTYVFGDAAFVGDTLFMPDFGTARCDFPGGDASTLFQSIQKIFALPESTRIFLCHDYKAPGRDTFVWETTVADQKNRNVHVGTGNTLEDFVRMRTERDARLDMPALILPSVQVNIRAGRLPPAEANGVSYLKIPVNRL